MAGEMASGVTEDVTDSDVVTVRYWAAARDAAGVDAEALPVGADPTVEGVMAAAVRAHPALERIARVATFLVDGRAAARETRLQPGVTVEVLPPFAGG